MFADCVMESSSTTGTGSYTLVGAVGASRTFAQDFADAATVGYFASNADKTKWELCTGTLTIGPPRTLSRTVKKSSNAGAAISWLSTDVYYVFSIASADAVAGLLKGSLATARPWWVSTGGSWLDHTLGLAVGWVKKRALSASIDSEEGRHYISPAIYAASQRALFVDKGAANYTIATDDVGKVLCFDTTASVRVLTMPGDSATVLGHGAYVDVMPYGSAANGVTFAPGGADTTDLATAPPGRMTRFQWDGAKNTWRADAPVYVPTPTAGDSSTKIATTAFVATALPPPHAAAISGWTYANSGADATNDIDIAAGAGTDSTNAGIITGAARIKRLDAAWAVGTNQGGLDTGSIGDSDYYIHAIKRVDTGVVDYLFSLSPTAPTMPANYTLRRLIGWLKRTAGVNVAFKTYEISGGGLGFHWNSPTLDIDLAATLTTARRTDALRVPLNFSVVVTINVSATHGATQFVAWVGCPDLADVAPSETAVPLANINFNGGYTVAGNAEQLRARTSAAGLIAARASVASIAIYKVSTESFEWSRR